MGRQGLGIEVSEVKNNEFVTFKSWSSIYQGSITELSLKTQN